MELGMRLNEHVNINTTASQKVDIFKPADGYALWRNNDFGNLDENGNPMMYNTIYRCQKSVSEVEAEHIFAVPLSDIDPDCIF